MKNNVFSPPLYKINVKTVSSSVTLPLVTTPSRCTTLGWSNWPMMLASHRKSRLCFSVKPTFSVLMATDMSRFPGSLSRPLHTSPNSPVLGTNAGLWVRRARACVCGVIIIIIQNKKEHLTMTHLRVYFETKQLCRVRRLVTLEGCNQDL